MEAVIFCGIQATGKTTFYRERFFDTHVRINLDMLRTRHRETILLHACIEAIQPFVVDNTNPTIEERRRYLDPARAAAFRVVGYFFDSTPSQALGRNELRSVPDRVPIVGILGTKRRLQVPLIEEGYSALYRVQIEPGGGFVVEQMDRDA